MTLVPLDSSTLPASRAMQEVAVSTYLEHAKQWLASAVEITGPEQIAQAKAEIATAAEATKQLNLSREIQLDAQEMVRRAEFALGKAVRKGQADGLIGVRSDNLIPGGPAGTPIDRSSSVKALDFFKHPTDREQTYAMADNATAEEFDTAIAEAKAEGNLSRANVVRKVKGQRVTQASASGVGTIRSPEIRQQRADLIAELAAQGHSIRQMPAKVGVAESTIRDIIRDYEIDVPAERSVGRTHRHDSARIASETVIALEGLVMGVELIDYGAIDPTQASQWVDSLDHSLRVLNRFRKQIKETTQ